MKSDIHPTYYANATATCACGATYIVGSTKEAIEVYRRADAGSYDKEGLKV